MRLAAPTGPRAGAAARPSSTRARRRLRPGAVALETRALLSVTFQIDYTYDTNRFFDPVAHPERRAILDAAARSIGAALGDHLAAIAPSPGNTWSATFGDPSTGDIRSVDNPSIPADTILLYVGGRSLVGTEAGFGGPGGFNAMGTQAFVDTVVARGQAGALNMQAPTDFGPWGGSIAFDTAATNWYFGDDPSGLQSNQTDFYTVALHEIGHVLGIGDVPTDGHVSPWSRLLVGNTFVGPNAEAAYGGQPVPVQPGGGHWAPGVTSGGAPALMDPTLLNGARGLYTPLDLAALRDIGWQVATPGGSVQFASPVVRVDETAGTATITVVRPDGGGSASVDYATSDNSAVAGIDYQSRSGALKFAPGQTTATITVPVLRNAGSRLNHVVNLTLGNPVGTTLGAQGTASLVVLDTDRPASAAFGDFDGDGKADLAVFRTTTAQWLIAQSTQGGRAQAFGSGSLDAPLEADFDGDGKLDLAVYRPSTAQWFILQSSAGPRVVSFGAPNLDVPIPADYDGDGKADIAVFRPSTAQWFILQSSAGPKVVTFGAANLDQPVPADYDGDGKADIAVFRPTSAQWFILQSTAGPKAQSFGAPGDIPIPADYDGDGRADIAAFRPGAALWMISPSLGGLRIQAFGGSGDLPVPADYDGDGRTDLAVFRPSTAQWFLLQTGAGAKAVGFGGPGIDYPLPTPLATRYRGGMSVRIASASFAGSSAPASASSAPLAMPLAWVDRADSTGDAWWPSARRRGMLGQPRRPESA